MTLQFGLLQDRVERARCQVIAVFAGNRHATGLDRMNELAVAAACSDQNPAIISKHSQDQSDFDNGNERLL